MAGAFFGMTVRRYVTPAEEPVLRSSAGKRRNAAGVGAGSASGTGAGGPGRLTGPATAPAERLPEWVTLFRAANPGPMTLDGTNTWVVRPAPGAPAVVIDAGPLDEGHLRAVAGSGPIGTVLTTHGHPDHVDGLDRLVELTGARVSDGEGGVPGRDDLRVRRIDAPGHTRDSVCFEVAVGDQRVMFTGDTVLGRGTTVVAWPDGDLGDYLASLAGLSAYEGVPALPGHGPALADCAQAARFYIEHRHARLAQVRAALEAGADTPAEVVSRVYPGIEESLRIAAEWSTRAQIAYLRGESRRGTARLDLP